MTWDSSSGFTVVSNIGVKCPPVNWFLNHHLSPQSDVLSHGMLIMTKKYILVVRGIQYFFLEVIRYDDFINVQQMNTNVGQWD